MPLYAKPISSVSEAATPPKPIPAAEFEVSTGCVCGDRYTLVPTATMMVSMTATPLK